MLYYQKNTLFENALNKTPSQTFVKNTAVMPSPNNAANQAHKRLHETTMKTSLKANVSNLTILLKRTLSQNVMQINPQHQALK